MWDIKTIVKDFIKTRDFQEFINHRFKDSTKIILSRDFYKTVSTDYATFYLDDMTSSVEEVERDYDLNDLRKTDIVLDIGACVGAFSLKVCRKVRHVYAIEPVMTERLKRNIQLNDVRNITVLDYALGDGNLNINWCGYTKTVTGISLSEIIKLCGGHVDFLKMDSEGGEWCIKPHELAGIRRIEAELHFNRKNTFSSFLKMLDVSGFEYIVNKPIAKPAGELLLVHAGKDRSFL